MSEPAPRYGDPAKGIAFADVSVAADALLRKGERPTVRKIRAELGTGSPNTINPMLDQWWKRLASRLDGGPAAFHRLPESVAHIAEALWLAALNEARGRAVLEQALDQRGVQQDQERLEIRSHVLSLRESEMESRLKERDKTIADLETRLQLMTTAARREQAGRNELARRIGALESARTAPKATRPNRKAKTPRPKAKKRSPSRKGKRTARKTVRQPRRLR